MTEIVTSGSMSGKVETELRRGLNGHGVGNDGHSQDQAYGPPRPFSTLHVIGRRVGARALRSQTVTLGRNVQTGEKFHRNLGKPCVDGGFR